MNIVLQYVQNNEKTGRLKIVTITAPGHHFGSITLHRAKISDADLIILPVTAQIGTNHLNDAAYLLKYTNVPLLTTGAIVSKAHLQKIQRVEKARYQNAMAF